MFKKDERLTENGLPTHRRFDAERRTRPRLDLRRAAYLVHEHGRFVGQVEDLAERGAGFATTEVEPELAEGDRVVLVFPPAADHLAPTEVPGVVARLSDYFDGQFEYVLYGIVFDETIDAAGLVASLAPARD